MGNRARLFFRDIELGENDPYYFRDPLISDATLFNRYLNGHSKSLNDGVWGYDDMHSNGKPDYVGNPTIAKEVWIGLTDYRNYGQTGFTPDYVSVVFPEQRTINTLVAVVPSSNVGMCGVRDYQFQVLPVGANANDPTQWVSVNPPVTNNTTEWVLHSSITPQPIMGLRLIINRINNGRWYDDYNTYIGYTNEGRLQPLYNSPMRAMVYELEAYGPTNQ